MLPVLPKYLDKGSSGLAVVVVKLLFVGTNYYTGYKIDGDYDPLLIKTITDFQKVNEIEADGNFGPETRERFELIYGANVNEIWLQSFEEQTMAMFPGKTKTRPHPGVIKGA